MSRRSPEIRLSRSNQALLSRVCRLLNVNQDEAIHLALRAILRDEKSRHEAIEFPEGAQEVTQEQLDKLLEFL